MSKENHHGDKIAQDLRFFVVLLGELVIGVVAYFVLYDDVYDLIASAARFDELPWFYLFIILLLVFECAKSYRVSEKGISIRRFGIQYRFIPWEQIDQIGFLDSRTVDKLMMITLKGCKRYRSWRFYAQYALYSLLHPLKVVNIYNLDKGRSVIEKYYGLLDYEIGGAEEASQEQESSAVSDAPETAKEDVARAREGSRRAEKVGPYWRYIVIGAIVSIAWIMFLCLCYLATNIFMIINNIDEIIELSTVIAYITFSCLFKSAKTFRVSEKGISIRRFGIPYRFIRWERVDQIGIHSPKTFHDTLLITLVGCKRCRPWRNYYLFKMYRLKHPMKVITIYNTDQARPAIEKYYGCIDYKY